MAGRLRQAVDEGRLEAGQVLLFRATQGDRDGDLFLIADRNGEAGYQTGEDLLVKLLDPGDFM